MERRVQTRRRARAERWMVAMQTRQTRMQSARCQLAGDYLEVSRPSSVPYAAAPSRGSRRGAFGRHASRREELPSLAAPEVAKFHQRKLYFPMLVCSWPIVTCFRALARLGDCAGWLRNMRLLAMLAPGYTLFVCPVPQSALAVMELAAGSWVRSHASEGAGSGFPSKSIAARQNPTKQLAIFSWFAESHSQQIHANHIRQVRSVN
ncbi:hypothetical protein SS50377_24106 [Spironucleus salmonicida]|uniref:Uncharacterized protein n=1 Tax=Spironucleus salmonicida TaxID=348837 RepID=A0A9P8RYK6_9EUKA|nr:hypothetical protein SS50377_24106 [Spironucleus salmonicida]